MCCLREDPPSGPRRIVIRRFGGSPSSRPPYFTDTTRSVRVPNRGPPLSCQPFFSHRRRTVASAAIICRNSGPSCEAICRAPPGHHRSVGYSLPIQVAPGSGLWRPAIWWQSLLMKWRLDPVAESSHAIPSRAEPSPLPSAGSNWQKQAVHGK